MNINQLKIYLQQKKLNADCVYFGLKDDEINNVQNLVTFKGKREGQRRNNTLAYTSLWFDEQDFI